MGEFLTNIGAIFQSLLNWLGEISSYLITNPIFIIILAIGIFSVLYYTIKKIIDIKNIKKMPYYNLDNDYESKNDSVIDKPIEEWTNENYDEDSEWSYLHSDY